LIGAELLVIMGTEDFIKCSKCAALERLLATNQEVSRVSLTIISTFFVGTEYWPVNLLLSVQIIRQWLTENYTDLAHIHVSDRLFICANA